MDPKTANFHGTTLLVIDVQQGLFTRRIPIYNAEALIENINLLAARAHSAGAPVIYIQHADGEELVEGSSAWELHPALKPEASDLRVYKHIDNAFAETNLQQLLRSRGVGRLVVAGLLTHACVKANCRAARKLGYAVVLVKDGHSSYSKDAARLIDKWNQKLGEIGCQVMATAEIEIVRSFL